MATNVYEGFESIHEFFHAIETRPVNSAFRGRSCESHGNDKSFTMCSSWEEAVNLLNKGWDEPLNEIKKGVERNFKSNTVREKNRPQTGVVGYAPCVPNAIMGLPNSMIMTEKTPTKIKAVTINYSMSVTAGITTNQLLKAGISLLNIINNLELAGYRVKLNVEFVSTEINGILHTVRVNVKDWRQPLDLKKLTFPLAHPSAFRRIGWRWLETSPKYASSYGDYGSSNFKDNYERAVKKYQDSNLLADNEYLITAYLCINSGYDEKKITKTCGLSALR